MMYSICGDMVIRDSIEKDADDLASRMRQSDVDEIWAASGRAPHVAICRSFMISEMCLTLVKSGKVIAMGGISPETPLRASIWLLASDDLNEFKISFLRQSKRIVAMFLERYAELFNYVYSSNLKSLSWLRWLGADIEPAAPYGISGRMFNKFTFRRM